MSEAEGTKPAANEADETFEEKVQAEMEKAKDMKVGELKMKLMAKGVLTNSFCEKSEFIRAYAESVVKEAEGGGVDVETADDEDAAVTNDDESEHDIMSGLPLCVKQRVEKLKELNEEREKAMKDYMDERAKLEAKYQELFKPMYAKRADIVLGKMDNEIAAESKDAAEGTEKGVPQFWLCTLGHMGPVAQMLTEGDLECLEHLQDITCVDDENGEGFTLNFHFGPNDYFENAVLTKRYDVPNLLLADEPILKNVEGCEIKWKPGRSLTHQEVVKTQKGKGKNAGQVRTVKKQEKIDSFFHFFTPPKMPSFDTMDEEQANDLEVAFDEDYDIAQAFRSHIIPKAVLWFTGEAMDKEMEAAMGANWPGADGSLPADAEANPECKQS